jgi:hypothetical protein
VFSEQWLGRGGPTAWPAGCPDLNRLDFYLWEHLKPTVYATEASDFQDLATTNTEWIGDGPYDTWNFSASQEIAVQQREVLRGRSRWTLRCFRRPMFI